MNWLNHSTDLLFNTINFQVMVVNNRGCQRMDMYKIYSEQKWHSKESLCGKTNVYWKNECGTNKENNEVLGLECSTICRRDIGRWIRQTDDRSLWNVDMWVILVWLRGAVVGQVRLPAAALSGLVLGKLFTYAPLLPGSINWYWHKLRR